MFPRGKRRDNLCGPLHMNEFETKFEKAWSGSEWRDLTVLVAVSGGPDSVALLRAMAALKRRAGGPGKLIVAHFNHRLRPDSDADAAFVAQLAARLELPIEFGTGQVAALAELRGDGIEAAARDSRYGFFQNVAERNGARYVATGHTADDQVETVLFNVLRGTGLAGLAGIPRARPLGLAASVIRPLLTVSRAEVIKYLAEIDQSYRIDPSNLTREFARNRLRNDVLPRLRESIDQDVDQSILRLSRVAADAQQLIERLAEELLDQVAPAPVVAPGPGRHMSIDLGRIKSADRHLVREMFIALWRRAGWPLQEMGFDQWDWLAELAQREACATESTKRMLPGGIVIERMSNGIMRIGIGPSAGEGE